jgi:hypothetical protein
VVALAGGIPLPAVCQSGRLAIEQRSLGVHGVRASDDPSVTTLNAAAAAGALNVFLMGVIGLADEELADHRITLIREGATLVTCVPQLPECRWCGIHDHSRYARADLQLLPCRQSNSPAPPLDVGWSHRIRRWVFR